MPTLRKKESSHINNLTLYLKELEKEDQSKHKGNRRKEIIKIRVEINEIDNRKKKINKTKSWFWMINRIDKTFARLTKEKRERTQVNKIGNGRGDITTDTTEIHRVIRDYFENYTPTNWTT